MPFCLRAGLLAVLLGTLPAAVWAEASPTAKPTDAPPPAAAPQHAATAHVEGFRSARWGMTEAQVKAAIKTDFNIGEDKLKGTENLAEKTQVLTITAPDVLEGAGTAQISYIFGFASKKLIQVNLMWSTVLDPQATPEKIVAGADQLRVLFLGSGYDPQTMTANAKMADGSILVFEGQDADKHTTLLRLATGTATPNDKDGKAGKPVPIATLSLSYILDAREPDIFRLKKGSF